MLNRFAPLAHLLRMLVEVINSALKTRPPNGTHWSVRGMAAHTGVSNESILAKVHRLCLFISGTEH